MSTVRASKKPTPREWTVADLQRRFGPIPFARIRQHPAPGTATEEDVLWLNDHEDRLYELVDGILVEKTVGLEESWIAGTVLALLKLHVEPKNLGFVTGCRRHVPPHNGEGAHSRRRLRLLEAHTWRQSFPRNRFPTSSPTLLSR